MTIQPTAKPSPFPAPPATGVEGAVCEPAAPPVRARSERRPSVAALAATALLCAGAACLDTAMARAPRHAQAHAGAAASSSAYVQGVLRRPPQAPAAPPEPVYRCGHAYSPQACPGATPLDVGDPRSMAQRLQAQDVAERDKRLAAWLEAQRHEREAPPLAAKKRHARPVRGCVQTPALACPDKPPRARHAVAKARPASAPAPGSAGSPAKPAASSIRAGVAP